MKYEYFGDYHTHTPFSHGTGTVMENAMAGAARGLRQIAITDHGFRHMAYHIKRSEITEILREVRLAERETGLDILMGVESNVVGRLGEVDIKEGDLEILDVLICGYHKLILPHRLGDALYYMNTNVNWMLGYCTKRKRELNTDVYLRMLEKYPIDFISHIGYGMSVDFVRVAKQCAELGTFIELNGKRINFSDDEFRAMIETGVRFIVSSDAHSADRVGEFSTPEALLERVPLPPERIANVGGMPDFRLQRYKRERGMPVKQTSSK